MTITFLDAGATSYGIQLEEEAKRAAAADNATAIIQSANFDSETQLAQCQNAIASHKSQGLLIYPVDNAAVMPCVRQALAAKLKVATIETQAGPNFCVSSRQPQLAGVSYQLYEPCPAEDGVFWATMAHQACAGRNPCNVAFFSGPASYALVPLELAALKNALRRYPNIKVIAHYAVGYDAPQQASASTQDLMLKYPQTNVIVEDDDGSAAGVAQTLAHLGKTKSVALIGFGGNASSVARIKAGTEFGTIISTPHTNAKNATLTLVKIVRGGVPAVKSLDMSQISPLGKGDYTITKANVDRFTAQW